LRSICETLIPKLVSQDVALIQNLLLGVFPKCQLEEIKEEQLRVHILGACELMNYCPSS